MKCHYTARCILLTICILQVISTSERQIFDFLGRMWLPILCNFFNFIFVIFGFFGAYQYQRKYIIVYLVWMVIWLTWNIFVICFYLNVGVLSNQTDVLNFGTGSISWWQANGIGCKAMYPTNLTEVDVLKPLRPDIVKGCLLDYEYVETVHAAFQCCFALPGIAIACYLIKVFTANDELCNKKKPASIYYVEYSSPHREGSESPDLREDNYQQPMTPRKVKRHNRYRSSGRSQGRNSQGRSSQYGTQIRNSQRTRRQQYLNPVTHLIDKANESSTSTDSYHPGRLVNRRPPFGNNLGHSNPMYVHSRPNSTFSLNGSEPLERPPSVHSSYSNYHGQRPSLNPKPNDNSRHNFIGSNPRKGNSEYRSTFKPRSLFNTGSESSLKGGTRTPYPSDTFNDSERPPPYMFGVNSETVI